MPRSLFQRHAAVRDALHMALSSHLDDPSLLDRLAHTAKPLSFKHDELVWAKGETDTIAFALDGTFDVIHNQIVVDTVGTRQFFGISTIFGRPHGEDIRARKTDKNRFPEILLWSAGDPKVLDLFRSAKMLMVLLESAQELIHHLNELQVLHRRKRGAVAHVASHLRRLVGFRGGSGELEIGQQELGRIAGYGERTIRLALSELIRIRCIGRLRRSEYRLDVEALTQFIESEKVGGTK